MGLLTATMKYGHPLRNEWTNIGVLVYGHEQEGLPLVAYRLVTDWERVHRRSEETSLSPDEIRQHAEQMVSEYQSYARVERGIGWPVWMIVDRQGSSVDTDVEGVLQRFWEHCIYDPEQVDR